MQGLILAAGMGKRLGEHTRTNTKCMVKVNDKTIIERSIEALLTSGIKKIVIVTGYESKKLIDFIQFKDYKVNFVFVHNPDYSTTNNIYSLYLAKEYLTEDTILLESDLIFDYEILEKILSSKYENIVAVSQYKHWMDGTVSLIDSEDNIIEFIEKSAFDFQKVDEYYKTINIYKFSKEFLERQYIPFLEAYITAYGTNEYYELVLKAIAHLSRSGLKALEVGNLKWYEIDDIQDMEIAEVLFSNGERKLKLLENKFGGFWRYTDILDFCYLVNPYYPVNKMNCQIKYFFHQLVSQYPSGMNTQRTLAGKLFHLKKEEIIIGNGAGELIAALGTQIKGKVVSFVPTFHEYISRFQENDLHFINTLNQTREEAMNQLMEAIEGEDLNAVMITNPENPTGAFIKYDSIIKIIEKCDHKNTKVIIDESFVDFADKDKRYTLIDRNILSTYKNLIIVKSISKSYGVPGLRLGVMATGDTHLLKNITKILPVWNINSFAEYFLQIANLYENDYIRACDLLVNERHRFMQELTQIPFLEVYTSQANYVMCKVKKPYTARGIAIKLLDQSNCFIKDLSSKMGFDKRQYIRIAVRDEQDNNKLINALKDLR